MFENQPPALGSGIVLDGTNTVGVSLMAANSTRINVAWIDTIYLGAAGSVLIMGNATQLSTTLYFASAGHQYIGLPFKAPLANDAITANVTLAANSVGSTLMEINFRRGHQRNSP